MSDLSDLQPTIFFAMCTLKGVLWIPWYLLPELYLKRDADADEDADLYGDVLLMVEEEVLVQDHHVLLMERVCHYTNIFALVGMLSFYVVNPRLWQYRKYGWWLLALLVLQHVPQAAQHEGWFPSNHGGGDGDDGAAATVMTTADMLATNRIFSTVGVVIVHVYAVVYGYRATLQRLAAEPFFVFFSLVTMLLETHVTCLSVWAFSASHLSTAVSWGNRQVMVGSLMAVLVGAEIWYSKQHPAQAKLLRQQLRTINTKPKLKSV